MRLGRTARVTAKAPPPAHRIESKRGFVHIDDYIGPMGIDHSLDRGERFTVRQEIAEPVQDGATPAYTLVFPIGHKIRTVNLLDRQGRFLVKESRQPRLGRAADDERSDRMSALLQLGGESEGLRDMAAAIAFDEEEKSHGLDNRLE